MGEKAHACGWAAVLASLPLTGCCAVTGGMKAQAIVVKSDPAGAQVYVDDKPRGKAPVTVPMERDSQHTVRLELAGYETTQAVLKPGPNPWLFGNLIVGGIVGVVVDGVTQSWYRLYPGDVVVRLRPQGATSP